VEKNNVRKLMQYLDASPSCYHATENLRQHLLENGYRQLLESESWQLERGGKYVVVRNDSSLIAFRIPEKVTGGFLMAAAHSDSPTMKLREAAEVEAAGSLVVSVEPYGGAIYQSWLDRPLSVAGRVVTEENGKLVRAAYEASSVPFAAFCKVGCDHHPHALPDNTPVIEFIEKYYE
jgi:aspartyl aminopeptidase